MSERRIQRVAAVAAIAMVGCNGHKKEPPNAAEAYDVVTRLLGEPLLDDLRDPLKGTQEIPQAGAMTYTPDAALGTLWAIKLKDEGKSCRDAGSKSEQLEIVPLGQFLAKSCRTTSATERNVYSVRITEKAAAKLDVAGFLGASGNGERIFELSLSHPIAIVLEREDDCLPLDEIRKLQITAAMGYCSLRWAKATLLTTLTWRSFVSVGADAKGSYALIKFGGELYASTEETRQYAVLTGNYSDLSPRIGRDEATGNLVTSAPPKPVASVPSPTPDLDATQMTIRVPKIDDRVFDRIRDDSDWTPPAGLRRDHE